MQREIGSEFWISSVADIESDGVLPDWLTRYGETTLTMSGRGAISLLLQQINPINKNVLLPAYICESVIAPFIDQGYTCYFYEVDETLSPIIESIDLHKDITVFLHIGYYGFQTNSNLFNVLREFKQRSVIIIEDVTHTLFSTYKRYDENDFYIGSIRKWFGLPTGGFLASSNNSLNEPMLINNKIPLLREAALLNKAEYMINKDESLKKQYTYNLMEAESLLDSDFKPYKIDQLSSRIISRFDERIMMQKRRNNYRALHEGIKSIDFLETPFKKKLKDVCPIFYPVIINKNRDKIRKKLVDERIYCPIHWPIPNQINNSDISKTSRIYNTIMSIPCDQRYGLKEMDRIISVIKSF